MKQAQANGFRGIRGLGFRVYGFRGSISHNSASIGKEHGKRNGNLVMYWSL